MKAYPLLFALLFPVCLMSANDPSKPSAPQPKGEPGYQRAAEGWSFACWTYQDSRAIHGRLWNKEGEVIGKKLGETIETNFGTVIWRGPYSPDKVPEKSTGWLFIESFSGPPNIRDRYDPKTDTLK